MDVQDHTEEKHDGELREIFVQGAAGRRHPRSAIADGLQVGISRAEFANEVCPMHIAARLANGEKDGHRKLVRQMKAPRTAFPSAFAGTSIAEFAEAREGQFDRT
jgi:hypothetical protein